MQKQQYYRLNIYIDFKVVLISKNRLNSKLIEVNILSFVPNIKQYNLSLDYLYYQINNKLYKVIRISLILRLQNTKLSNLKYLLRFLAYYIVVVLQTNLDVLNYTVDQDVYSSFVLLKIKQYQLSQSYLYNRQFQVKKGISFLYNYKILFRVA